MMKKVFFAMMAAVLLSVPAASLACYQRDARMAQNGKAASKQEQSQARLSSAEREQARPKVKAKSLEVSFNSVLK